MTPARTYPARRDDVRLLVVDPDAGAFRETRTTAISELLARGDLLVVNDAATLPASLHGRDDAGRPIELRLIAADGDRPDGARFWAVLLGAGDWRQRTEDRPPPAVPALGARLSLGDLGASVVALSSISPRLVAVGFDRDGDALWEALYRLGRPVQYSYLAHPLPLWAVQTVYAARPWAFEMPSAGRPLSWETLLALRRKGVRWAALTHAAGLSATGDPAIDAALPLPERYDIPAATVRAIEATRRGGGRVVAVGTTVVRALEGAAEAAPRLRDGAGITSLRIGRGFRPRIVGGVLTGTHAAGESHHDLLAAFVDSEPSDGFRTSRDGLRRPSRLRPTRSDSEPSDGFRTSRDGLRRPSRLRPTRSAAGLLADALAYAERTGFATHELGDAMLILPGGLRAQSTVGGAVTPQLLPPSAAAGS